MEKGLARPVRKLDKAKAFFAVEPFHFGLPVWAGTYGTRLLFPTGTVIIGRRRPPIGIWIWRFFAISTATVTKIPTAAHSRSECWLDERHRILRARMRDEFHKILRKKGEMGRPFHHRRHLGSVTWSALQHRIDEDSIPRFDHL
jgi:hypothetical protein